MAIESRKTQIVFPGDLTRFPAYSNATLVSIFNDDFVIDFGFVEPLSFLHAVTQPSQTDSETNEESSDIKLVASPVSRIVLSKRTAETLLNQLQELFGLAGGQ